MKITHSPTYRWLLIPMILICLALACERSAPDSPTPWAPNALGTPYTTIAPTNGAQTPGAEHTVNGPVSAPTPDPPHLVPTPRKEPEIYIVKSGDTLGGIADMYHLSLEALIAANELPDPNVLEIDQEITIPVPTPSAQGPSFKIIPNSELVYGPASVGFDIERFVKQKDGYLSQYHQAVDDLGGQTLTGAQIVARVSSEYSVNPRLLLAVLEQQSGWVTKRTPAEETIEFPIGHPDPYRKGLYRQLAFAASNLNRGYYLWKASAVNAWTMQDGTVVPIEPTINAGTAGVQYFFSLFYDRAGWEQAVTQSGFFATYNALFGYPFELAIEPWNVESAMQPRLQLPFETGVQWAFTGGPHAGWGDGSAWAALDFAPYIESLGCGASDAWVVAAADGLILRADQGEVVQDLDVNGPNTNDGQEQTGWTLLYMHIEARDRVTAGTYLHAGERIGHPSCEGGVSSATHLHLARRYNGEWIPADTTMPFVMDGWISRGTGTEYDGFLEKDDAVVEAWDGIRGENAIQR